MERTTFSGFLVETDLYSGSKQHAQSSGLDVLRIKSRHQRQESIESLRQYSINLQPTRQQISQYINQESPLRKFQAVMNNSVYGDGDQTQKHTQKATNLPFASSQEQLFKFSKSQSSSFNLSNRKFFTKKHWFPDNQTNEESLLKSQFYEDYEQKLQLVPVQRHIEKLRSRIVGQRKDKAASISDQVSKNCTQVDPILGPLTRKSGFFPITGSVTSANNTKKLPRNFSREQYLEEKANKRFEDKWTVLKVQRKRHDQQTDVCRRQTTRCEGRVLKHQLQSTEDLIVPDKQQKVSSFDLVQQQNFAFKRFNVIPDTQNEIREAVLLNSSLTDFDQEKLTSGIEFQKRHYSQRPKGDFYYKSTTALGKNRQSKLESFKQPQKEKILTKELKYMQEWLTGKCHKETVENLQLRNFKQDQSSKMMSFKNILIDQMTSVNRNLKQETTHTSKLQREAEVIARNASQVQRSDSDLEPNYKQTQPISKKISQDQKVTPPYVLETALIQNKAYEDISQEELITMQARDQSPIKEQRRDPVYDIKFDAIDNESQTRLPDQHYFIKKLKISEKRENFGKKKKVTKLHSGQITVHQLPEQTQIDHQKLVQHYCEYLLPELKSETSLLSSDAVPPDAQVTVINFKAPQERYQPYKQLKKAKNSRSQWNSPFQRHQLESKQRLRILEMNSQASQVTSKVETNHSQYSENLNEPSDRSNFQNNYYQKQDSSRVRQVAQDLQINLETSIGMLEHQETYDQARTSYLNQNTISKGSDQVKITLSTPVYEHAGIVLQSNIQSRTLSHHYDSPKDQPVIQPIEQRSDLLSKKSFQSDD